MLNGRKIIVVMPAYNAAKTLAKTVSEIPRGVVDEILLVDDASSDDTVKIASKLGLTVFQHDANFGYGRNQKTCYAEALMHNADIVVMLHPDYQYSPQLIVPMASMIAYGEYDVVIGSRILGKLSEYHTGFRAFRREVIESLPIETNSDDFVFDNQMLAQVIYCGFRVGEMSCPTRYFSEASSINFSRSVRYGLGVLATSFKFRFHKMGLTKSRMFAEMQCFGRSEYYSEVEPEQISNGKERLSK